MRVRIRPFPPAEPFRQVPDEVDVWTAWLDRLAVPASVLTEGEIERSNRYRHAVARDQFIRARGFLRVLLSRYLDTEARSIEIVPRPDGKPELAGRFEGTLQFNLSHSEGLALAAVSRRPVGVDVEKLRPVSSEDGLVERFFSGAERDQYRLLPAELRTAAFFRCWVGKEAVLKGIGCGARELDRCVVDIDPRRPIRIVGPPATLQQWAVAGWEPAEGYYAAVAVEGVRELVLDLP